MTFTCLMAFFPAFHKKNFKLTKLIKKRQQMYIYQVDLTVNIVLYVF